MFNKDARRSLWRRRCSYGNEYSSGFRCIQKGYCCLCGFTVCSQFCRWMEKQRYKQLHSEKFQQQVYCSKYSFLLYNRFYYSAYWHDTFYVYIHVKATFIYFWPESQNSSLRNINRPRISHNIFAYKNYNIFI